MSGFEVATALKERESTSHIPILAFTAKELTAKDREQLEMRFSAVIAKGTSSGKRLIHAIHDLDARPAVSPASA
jgi:CheY-like chemotaxis protein